jgi:hypothetical protein
MVLSLQTTASVCVELVGLFCRNVLVANASLVKLSDFGLVSTWPLSCIRIFLRLSLVLIAVKAAVGAGVLPIAQRRRVTNQMDGP